MFFFSFGLDDLKTESDSMNVFACTGVWESSEDFVDICRYSYFNTHGDLIYMVFCCAINKLQNAISHIP